MAEENIVIKIKADIGVTKDVIDAVTKAMENLGKTATIVTGNVKVTNKNLEDTNKILGQVAQTATKTSNAIDGNISSLKKSNQQWTNLALVVQDLPFGFRGIQNNLPALIGGMASVTGGIYFATSAVIAFFTAYDMGLFKSLSGTSRFEEANRKAGEVISGEATQVLLLVEQYKKSNTSNEERINIIKKLNDISPQFFGNLDKEHTSISSLNGAYLDYVNNLGNVVKAKILEDELSKKIQERLKFEYENGIAILKSGYYNPEYVNKHTKALAEHSKMLQNEATLAQRITDLSKVNVKQDTSVNQDKINKLKAANEAETKAYLSGLDDRAKEEFQAGLDLQNGLEKMRAAGYTNSETYYAAYKANMIKIAQKYDDIEYKRNQDSIKANIDFETKIYNDSMRIYDENQKKKADAQAKYTKNTVDSLELELKTQLKLHKSNITLMQEDIANKIKQLELLKVFAFSNAKSIEIIDKAIENQKAQLKGLGERWDNTAQNIKKTIEGVMTDVIVQFATNIGKALAGEKVDLFGGIGEIIAEGAIAIGKALVAYGVALEAFKLAKLNPLLAIVAGTGLVIAGNYLKSKLAPKKEGGATPFANGGIVSGPTMGLIGEYPGAKSNPEVVAPLDKLKDMIGGQGGGQFVLRGNDLVLALTRSETSLNLRRGA